MNVVFMIVGVSGQKKPKKKILLNATTHSVTTESQAESLLASLSTIAV